MMMISKTWAAIAVAMLAFDAAPAVADVVDVSPTGFQLSIAVHIAALPDRVYAALIQPAKWWNAQHTFSGSAANLTLDAKAGGCFCETLPNGGSVKHQEVVFAAPGQVLRMTGAGVELLVEPWELGMRKAKEFLLTGDRIDAQEAWRLGLVNRVVAKDRLAEEVKALAERIALVPPATAQLVKDSINHTFDLMGKSQAFKYHFMAHHWMHNTATALGALEARKQKGSMQEVLAERDRGDPAS